MTARSKTRAREAQLGFEALSIEGGLLSPEWLSRVAQLTANGQSEADYRIPKGLNLRDEIGRYWRIAQAHWSELSSDRANKADSRELAERFVEALLREAFGFASLTKTAPAMIAERSYPISLSTLGGRVPVVVAPIGNGLDTAAPAFGDGGRRRSAFGLTQEYLNAQDGALWGLASDGLTLRILRDNASLTRPAWIEADLQRIFTEERYADFAAIWLLAHETRFGRADQPATECALEAWRTAGQEEGTRAREHLRRGVEAALVALGQGFLAHPENQLLRSALQDGSLTTKEYFNQLLRLVYRLIFLLTVEERGLLHPSDADENAKALYAEGYSLRRLRERSVRRNAHDRFSDLWEATRIVFRGVATGEPRLGLPALAGIFAKNQCSALDAVKLENRAFLLAVFKLAWLRDDSSLARVNWRDMGPEELGSVYESLLELVPQIAKGGRQFAFATGGETKGNARKTSGSYYTPDALVQVLLDSALEPVITDTIASNPENAVEALLNLSVVDPACGSGHFLLAAARRLAAHVARQRSDGTPAAAEYRHALRQVVGRCIYGVDLNSMAVELCKVSLWLEAVEPGLPLTFLNSHIQHGNALLGTTPELMAKGIPDAAWEPIECDDKKTASALKRRNKSEAGGQRALDLGSNPSDLEAKAVARAVAELEAASDANSEALAKKESQWDGILGSPEYRHQKFVADAWCSAFVWPKQPDEFADAGPTNELWRQLRDGKRQPPVLTIKAVRELSEQYRFLHWHLQFPQVFAKGGFDVVLGNPPWGRVKLQQEEWFAERLPEVASARNAAERKRLIGKLPSSQADAFAAFQTELRAASGEAALLTSSSRFPLCGRGDVNTYSVFAELSGTILSQRGMSGLVVPPGILTDDSNKIFARDLVARQHLHAFYAFTNRGYTFREVESTMSFSLLVTGRRERDRFRVAGQLWSANDLRDPNRVYALAISDVALFNPNTRSLPVFRGTRDMAIARRIYEGFPVLEDEGTGINPWGARMAAMFHMANASEHFKARDDLMARDGWVLSGNQFVREDEICVPLYESKLAHQFNHRHATFNAADQDEAVFRRRARTGRPTERQLADSRWLPIPRYWLPLSLVLEAVGKRDWLLVYRRTINAVADARSVVATILPLAGVGDSLFLVSGISALDACALVATLNSFVFDYLARQKATGGNLSFYLMKQLPVIPPDRLDEATRNAIRDRVLELTVTADDLLPFAAECGYLGGSFRWDPVRREHLRAELDAMMLRLYGLPREEAEYVLDYFDVVRRRDEERHGEYRTKLLILEIYDAMVEAVHARKPYQTRLDPPPADPRVANPPRVGTVVPLPSRTFAPRALPAWGDELFAHVASRAQLTFAAGAWGTSLSGGHLGMTALAAVLRNLSGPRAREDVERAVVLVLLPRLMQPNFDNTSATQWRSVIGSKDLAVTSVDAFGIPWSTVIRKAIQQNVLAENSDGRWGAGTDVADVPSPVFDARALVVLAWLATAPAEDAEVTKQMRGLRAA